MLRENRYFVFKITDMEYYLMEEERRILEDLQQKINQGRLRANKQPLQGVICESDWPEYEAVWQLIEARVEKEYSAS